MRRRTQAAIAAASIAGVVAIGVPQGAVGSAKPAGQATRTAATAGFTRIAGPGTAFSAADPALLRRYGYTEQEYFVTGEACRYKIVATFAAARVVDCGHPFKTRMLVRQPADPARFNGTALVEWTNTSTGHDVDFAWAATHDYDMREGYAEVSLSAEIQGVDALKGWNPDRYGSLSLDAPLLDPATGVDDLAGAHDPSDPNQELLSYDAFTQTVAGLRAGGRGNPIRGRVSQVIAVGQSQSAGRLTDYYNSIDPLYRVIDGAVFYDRAGKLRPDSPVKAISVASELGIRISNTLPLGDAPSSRYWEVAGTSHNSVPESTYFDPMIKRDGWITDADGHPGTLSASITGCSQGPAWSTVPTGYVLDSAIDHVVDWDKSGRPAPLAPRLVRDPDAPTVAGLGYANGMTFLGYAVDDHDLTLGGIHLAEYDYSNAVNKGAGTTGPGVCAISGMHHYYTDAELVSRYPDPRAYLIGARALIRSNVARGYLLPSDAASSRAYVDRVHRRLVRLATDAG